MANQPLTIQNITKEAARVLENNLTFVGKINREYSDTFAKAGAKQGSVINVRKPPRYIGRTGQALSLEDATETSIPLALTTQFGVDIAFSDADMLLSINDFSRQFVKPALAKIANKMDFDALNLYLTVYNAVGTPGTVPITTAVYLSAGQRMSEEATPFEDRTLCVNPAMNAGIVNALTGLFNPQATIAGQYKKGLMARDTLGFDWYIDQNIRIQTVGPLGGAPLVNGAGQTGSSLITNGWTAVAASRLNQGDRFTVGTLAAGILAANPQNLTSTGALRQFVVTAPVSSDAGGNATIPISPALTFTGPFQTCVLTGATMNGLALNIFGAANAVSPQGLAFHPDAFVMGSADLPLPGGVDMSGRENASQLGFSIRMIRDYDINTDRRPCRTDVLYGFAVVYPELACVIAS